MAFLPPCSFSFSNKDCQGLHSKKKKKRKIYSLQRKICQNLVSVLTPCRSNVAVTRSIIYIKQLKSNEIKCNSWDTKIDHKQLLPLSFCQHAALVQHFKAVILQQETGCHFSFCIEYSVPMSTSYLSMGASCCSCCSLMVWYSFSNFFNFFWLIC